MGISDVDKFIGRYYYRPNPNGPGGVVGIDNQEGVFIPAPGVWRLDSNYRVISFPFLDLYGPPKPWNGQYDNVFIQVDSFEGINGAGSPGGSDLNGGDEVCFTEIIC
jgi:hypothetical protein